MKMRYIALLISLPLILACGIQASFAPLPVASLPPEFATPTPQISTQNTPMSKTTSGCFGTVTAAKLNLRADADYHAPADGAGLTEGDVVRIVGIIGDWYKVKTTDGRAGYAHSKYIHGCTLK